MTISSWQVFVDTLVAPCAFGWNFELNWVVQLKLVLDRFEPAVFVSLLQALTVDFVDFTVCAEC